MTIHSVDNILMLFCAWSLNISSWLSSLGNMNEFWRKKLSFKNLLIFRHKHAEVLMRCSRIVQLNMNIVCEWETHQILNTTRQDSSTTVYRTYYTHTHTQKPQHIKSDPTHFWDIFLNHKVQSVFAFVSPLQDVQQCTII